MPFFWLPEMRLRENEHRTMRNAHSQLRRTSISACTVLFNERKVWTWYLFSKILFAIAKLKLLFCILNLLRKEKTHAASILKWNRFFWTTKHTENNSLMEYMKNPLECVEKNQCNWANSRTKFSWMNLYFLRIKLEYKVFATQTKIAIKALSRHFKRCFCHLNVSFRRNA